MDQMIRLNTQHSADVDRLLQQIADEKAANDAQRASAAASTADTLSAMQQRHTSELSEQEARLRGSWEEEKQAMQRQWAADEEARREAVSLAAVAREREDAERNRQLSIERLEWMKERQKGEEGA